MNYGRESLASGWGVEVGTRCFEANIHTRKKGREETGGEERSTAHYLGS